MSLVNKIHHALENFLLLFPYIQYSSIIHINANPLLGTDVVPAAQNEFPFVVSFGLAPATKSEDHFCGGTLISKKHILTAEHCLVDLMTNQPKMKKENIRVTIGSIDMTRGRKYNVTSWLTYEEWALENNEITENIYHDTAIVTLSKEIENIKPVTISKLKHKDLYGQIAVTAGWGLNDDGVDPQVLQKASLLVISRKKCRFNFEHFNQPPFMVVNHLCTIHRPPVILGCGDSGGPLLLNGTDLIGVNGSICANDIHHPNEQNAHLSVEYYRKFIEAFAEKTLTSKR